jgi:hypothetical protein
MRIAKATAVLILLVAFMACGTDSGYQGRKSADWATFVERFADDWLQAHPLQAFSAGRREYAGKFPDWSRQGIIAEIKRLKSLGAQARTFDEDNLSDDQRFERNYLLAVIDRNLFWLDRAEWPFRNPTFYFNWNLDFLSPDPYLTKPYAPLDERMRDFTKWLGNLPGRMGRMGRMEPL